MNHVSRTSVRISRRFAPHLAAVVGVSACLWTIVAPLSAGDELFTPRHVAQTKMVSSSVIAPDGQRVAYTLAVPRNPLEGDNGAAWGELHVLDPAGKSRPFVTGEVNVSGVQWTPDGSGIAFITQRDGDAHNSLYVIPIDGGESRRVVTHDASVGGVAFSRNGTQIAFLATEPRSKEQQGYAEKGFNQEIYEEDWRATKVWIVPADGSKEPRSLDIEGSASSVDWSPSGRQLVVVLAPTPLVDDYYMFKRVHVVDPQTGRIVQRINNPGKLGQVAWSPDEKHLAMISGVDIHDPADGHLMVATVPGDGSVRDLMPGYEAHVTSFVWSGESTITWVADEGTGSAVGEVTLKGERDVLIEPGGPVLSGISLSDDGQKMVFVGHGPTHPKELYLLAQGEQAARRLTHSNPWMSNVRFARQEVVRHKARDGLELEGILVYPVNYLEGRRYPLILLVHGGPESHVSNGWLTYYSRPGQVGAARGFAVFYPNYRGSTGRGVAFSKMGQADAAGKEFDDLIDAVDHLVAIGVADKDKVGITGGSYGGYASAWGTTYYSDRFAASVMFVGISDNISKVGTTDIPEEMYLVHHRKRLWDDWDYFLDRSPIRYVERNRTPTLILHGKSDPRVHPSQSLELFRHLKTLDQAPARLVLYPGEGHGNRRAAARFDYNVRLLRWMEHYLQGPGGPAPDYLIDYAAEFGGE